MGGGAAQALHGHVLVGHGPDHLGAGDEHVARALRHEHEVGDRRRVHRAARARPQDRRDLRHHAGGDRVAEEDVGVARERHDALLDAGAARVVEPDDRDPELEGEVHDLADLLGVRLGERAAEHREVLREDGDLAALDAAEPGDDAVAGDALALHAEVVAAVHDEAVHLLERTGVEEQVEPLARGELARGVLPLDALLPAPLQARALELSNAPADVVAHLAPQPLSGRAGKRTMLSRRRHGTGRTIRPFRACGGGGARPRRGPRGRLPRAPRRGVLAPRRRSRRRARDVAARGRRGAPGRRVRLQRRPRPARPRRPARDHEPRAPPVRRAAVPRVAGARGGGAGVSPCLERRALALELGGRAGRPQRGHGVPPRARRGHALRRPPRARVLAGASGSRLRRRPSRPRPPPRGPARRGCCSRPPPPPS